MLQRIRREIPETTKSTATDLLVIRTKHFALGVENIEQAKKFGIKNDISMYQMIWKLLNYS